MGVVRCFKWKSYAWSNKSISANGWYHFEQNTGSDFSVLIGIISVYHNHPGDVVLAGNYIQSSTIHVWLNNIKNITFTSDGSVTAFGY